MLFKFPFLYVTRKEKGGQWLNYYVQVERGIKLYVEEIGAGWPIIIVHGWPVNHKMFEYQTTHLPKYGFRCIQIDLRGFGHSDAPWAGQSAFAI